MGAGTHLFTILTAPLCNCLGLPPSYEDARGRSWLKQRSDETRDYGVHFARDAITVYEGIGQSVGKAVKPRTPLLTPVLALTREPFAVHCHAARWLLTPR